MNLFFMIDPTSQAIVGQRQLPDGRGYNGKDDSAVNGKPFLVPVVVTKPPYDPGTQVREGPVDEYVYATNAATRKFTVRDKTAQELRSDRDRDDERDLRSAGKNIALVLVELIEWQLANTGMQAADFTPDVRQAFLDIKAIADRLRE